MPVSKSQVHPPKQRAILQFMMAVLFLVAIVDAIVLAPLFLPIWEAKGREVGALFLHVLIAVIMTVLAVTVSRHERTDRQTYAMMGLLILFLPVVGPILSFLILAQVWVGKNPERTVEEDDEFDSLEIKFELMNLPPSTENSEQRIARETDIVPLADIMEGSDIALIRGAVDKLAQLKSAESIRILMDHRSSTMAEVRFFVTSALTRIKNEYDEELESAKNNLKHENYKVSARFFLAEQYANYAASGLLDERMAESYFQEALEHLQIVIQSPYATKEAAWFMLSILQTLGRNQEAMMLLEREALFGGAQDLRRLQAQADIFYSMHEYGRLRHVLKQCKDMPDKDVQQSAVLDWWEV